MKAKKVDHPTKTPKKSSSSAEKKSTAKIKRKNWMKEKFKKKKPPPKKEEKEKSQKILPPKDATQFSTNWKALQEILKVSQAEKKQPVPPKENGIQHRKEAKDSPLQNMSKSKAPPPQTEAGKKVRHKSASGSFVSKDSEVTSRLPAASVTTGQSAAPKRERDGEKLHDELPSKKKKEKTVVEEPKVTEEDLWFDDVDPDDLEATVGAEAADIMRKKQGIRKSNDTESALVKEKAFEGLTKAVAIDCEMVGVGPDGEDSILARVSLVNQFGKCIYDKFVKPTEKVTDYRTAVSGIRPEDIKHGEDVRTVQREVAAILQGRVVVGHAIHNDLKILLLDHPRKKIRDTQKYKPFRKTVKTNRPSLKLLCKDILNVKVQQGEHSSVQDAQATMRLYTLVKKQWEAEIKANQNNKDLNKKSERKPKFPKNRGKKSTGL
ncbi:RNA exonuclease 4 [Xyrichtys novacula]|uniref:RNA exonuclease 4 n=1 Tax=Xyrichtys novacula TaxID=13765 RepID=A0AAV1H5W3_XYRNO|nr:RNA exonuclease 4 [Xyrichtys novacula]